MTSPMPRLARMTRPITSPTISQLPSMGTPRPNTSKATLIAAMMALTMPRPRYLPRTSSNELTGETRNSSSAPDMRSRTKDNAVSVTAMCWSISASAAGAAKPTTFGCVGATLVTWTVVGAATTSGGTRTGGDTFSSRYDWPSVTACRMISRLIC